jgi:hypothetical protein
MSMRKPLTHSELKSLLNQHEAKTCTCALGPCTAWESLPEERWPAAQMKALGSLRDSEVYEPSFEQYHPQGTHYDSADAPISAAHFPYNRCELHECQNCQRVLLRYTEYGGYYVDQRVRWARPELLVNPADI